MLVLRRREGETIVIDDTIQVTVVEVKGKGVRLGITAPPAVRVDRHEIFARRCQQAADMVAADMAQPLLVLPGTQR